jgi:hypothetical protein
MPRVQRRTPSRLKYEENHPTVSFRISKALHDRLDLVKKAEGKSTTDVLKVGLGLLEVKVANENEARRQGLKRGYAQGYQEAASRYKVTFPCRVCRKTMEVTEPKEKEAIKGYMLEHGWEHAQCNRGS